MSAPSPPSIIPSTIQKNHQTSSLPFNLLPTRAGTWALVRTLRVPANSLVSDTQPPVKKSAYRGAWAGGTSENTTKKLQENH